MDLETLKTELNKYGQSELTALIDAAVTISKIDLGLVSKLYDMARAGKAGGAEGAITPIPVTVAAELAPAVRRKYIEAGEELIRTGGFAAVTMAGGQGTRLGHNGPKGTFDIGVEEHSLFEIQAKRLLRRAALCGAAQIPWYIMTSEENDAATRAFFVENGWFGYDPANVRFFTQFMLPMVDFDGKIVRDTPVSVKSDHMQAEPWLRVCPNPATDYIDVFVNQEDSQAEIIDLNGKAVMTLQLKNKVNRISISGLPKGMYMLRVCPNPATDYIDVFVNQGDDQAEIIDLNGKTVMTLQLKNEVNRISISDLPKGVYMLRANGEVRKFVKQ